MREIEFKGFGISDKRWHYGFITIYESGKVIIGGFEVYPDSVGEYTGLKDKNGKRVYEKDIVLSQERLDRPYSKKRKNKRILGIVYYCIGKGNGFFNKETQEWNKQMEYSACWKVKWDKKDIFKYPHSSWGDFFDCEVVGNTYENPELLTK